MKIQTHIEYHESAMFPYKLRTREVGTDRRPKRLNDGFSNMSILFHYLSNWGWRNIVIPLAHGDHIAWSSPFEVEGDFNQWNRPW
jgi:hypothetical protein